MNIEETKIFISSLYEIKSMYHQGNWKVTVLFLVAYRKPLYTFGKFIFESHLEHLTQVQLDSEDE